MHRLRGPLAALALSLALALIASAFPASRTQARAGIELEPASGAIDTAIGAFFNQSAPGAVTSVPDPAGSARHVVKMTVSDHDVYPLTPTDNPRASLLTEPTIHPGDQYWWRSEFLLPQSFPSWIPGWVTLLEGPYGEPFDGTPPWHIEVGGNHIRWMRNDTYDWDVPWQMPLVRGRWVRILVHGRFDRRGFVEMWVDGHRITFFDGHTYNQNHHRATRRLRMQTRDRSNDEGPNFAALMSYREAGMFNTLTIYQGPMALGPTQASIRR
jgi:hypothetical protein